jgi:phosphoglycerol geranylgeranyltransferase
MNLYDQIRNEVGKIAVLIDPEKTYRKKDLVELIEKINKSFIAYIFIGGSTLKKINLDPIIFTIKQHTTLPVILFPGNHSQVSKYADAIFYLTLLTTENPKFLIEEQLKSTPIISKTNLEVIPTGYILLDENGESSTSKITQNSKQKITKKNLLNLSLTAKYLGKKIILIDAGSGSKKSIQNSYIKEIKKVTNLPILIGGGIKSTKEIINLKKLGVNIIIVGNYIEKSPQFLEEINKINNQSI